MKVTELKKGMIFNTPWSPNCTVVDAGWSEDGVWCVLHTSPNLVGTAISYWHPDSEVVVEDT